MTLFVLILLLDEVIIVQNLWLLHGWGWLLALCVEVMTFLFDWCEVIVIGSFIEGGLLAFIFIDDHVLWKVEVSFVLFEMRGFLHDFHLLIAFLSTTDEHRLSIHCGLLLLFECWLFVGIYGNTRTQGFLIVQTADGSFEVMHLWRVDRDILFVGQFGVLLDYSLSV
jgi:hypothetical protein